MNCITFIQLVRGLIQCPSQMPTIHSVLGDEIEAREAASKVE